MISSNLIVISGPTASGKTACAVELCLLIDGEVISADSMQIYRGMDILSAKPTEGETRGIPHHLIGIVNPDEHFSVSAYREKAVSAIAEIKARGKTPVLCGGTGLYIDAVTKGLRFSEPGDEAYRDELRAIAKTDGGKARLHDMLKAVDPESAKRFPMEDARRVIRSLEIFKLTGMTRGEQEAIDRARAPVIPYFLFALSWPKEVLYQRIDARVDQMVKNGLIDEVRALMDAPNDHPTAMQAIGYKEIACALRGEMTMMNAIVKMKTASRHYAKRQMTYLRRDARAEWIEAEGRESAEIAYEMYQRILLR